MSHWTSEYGILQDLSMVQGRVPVAVQGTLRAGDKPPSLNITEETEEEFYDKCSDQGEVPIAPDYRLIKRMLDMVRDINISEEEDNTDKVAVISKLNPESKPFVPSNLLATSSPLPKPTVSSPLSEPAVSSPLPKPTVSSPLPKPTVSSPLPKPTVFSPLPNPTVKKRQRNVALESILQAISENRQNELFNIKPEPMRLLKPNDFICEPVGVIENVPDDKTSANIEQQTSTEVAESVEKVKDWLENKTDVKQQIAPKKKRKFIVNLEASNMFKSKTPVQVKVDHNESVKENEVKKSKESNGVYVPSCRADEYYRKFKDQKKLSNSVPTTIWAQAEKIMREKEEAQRVKAAAAPPRADSGADCDDTSNHTTAD